jgi:prevent-host-death family protein
MTTRATTTAATTVGAYEAKTNLPELLRRVEKGERITITRHGHPVAELVPASDERRRRVAESITKLQEFSKGHKLDGMTIRQLIEEGRRY